MQMPTLGVNIIIENDLTNQYWDLRLLESLHAACSFTASFTSGRHYKNKLQFPAAGNTKTGRDHRNCIYATEQNRVYAGITSLKSHNASIYF